MKKKASSKLDSSEQFSDKQKIEMEAMFNYASTAITSMIYVNGGAAVAFLAFLGSLLSQKILTPQATLTNPMISFALGVGAALFASIVANVSIGLYYKFRKNDRIGYKYLARTLRIVAMVAVAISFVLFFLGIKEAESIMTFCSTNDL